MSAPRAFLRPERRFLLAAGADVEAWWQGQATNEMRVALGEPVAFCLVEATGQLRAVVDGIRLSADLLSKFPFLADKGLVQNSDPEHGYLFVTENPEVLLRRANDYVILEDVSLSILNGPVATILSDDQPPNLIGVPVPGGFDILLPEEHSVSLEAEEELLTLRLAEGVPQIGLDTSEKTLPPELGEWFDKRYIHYAKGCYMGQEVLQRIHSRGHVNRVWTVLRVSEPVAFASPVWSHSGDRVGAVTQCRHHSEFGWLVGAILKRDAAQSPLLIAEREAAHLL
ncbi:MAG: hypothetical protein KF812_07805 [Fimbriimonadaceae bacterium]|nr:hypothetical protein [Fimbriimonadaceae bacterium]